MKLLGYFILFWIVVIGVYCLLNAFVYDYCTKDIAKEYCESNGFVYVTSNIYDFECDISKTRERDIITFRFTEEEIGECW